MSDSEPIDPFLWLEDVLGERALAWVRERNAESQAVLQARPEYEPIRADLLEMMNSKERIPQVSRRGDWFYNLWQDEAHQRGLWRRTTFDEYRLPEPTWETVLDLDALAAAEGENWVWGGAVGLPPAHARVLISLSRGGADAAVVREFDTVAKTFVEGGFALPEAKSDVDWIDADTLYVGTDFGPGSLTTSGYPRIVKRWARGTPLSEAVTVFEVGPADMSAAASVDVTPGFERTLFVRIVDFYERRYFFLDGAELRPIDVPGDASIAFWNSAGAPEDTLLIELRSDWHLPGDTPAGQTLPSGALLAADARAYLAGERRFDVLFTPTPTRSLAGYTTTRSHLIVNVLDNVASRLENGSARRRASCGARSRRPSPARSARAVCTTRCAPTTRSPNGTCSATATSSRPTRSGLPTPAPMRARRSSRNRRISTPRACRSRSSSPPAPTARACPTS